MNIVFTKTELDIMWFKIWFTRFKEITCHQLLPLQLLIFLIVKLILYVEIEHISVKHTLVKTRRRIKQVNTSSDIITNSLSCLRHNVHSSIKIYGKIVNVKGGGNYSGYPIQVGLTHANRKVEMNPNTFRKSIHIFIIKNKDGCLSKINSSRKKRNKGNKLHGITKEEYL